MGVVSLADYPYSPTAKADNNFTRAWLRSTEFVPAWMNNGFATNDLKTSKLIPWTKFDRFYSIDWEQENPSARHYIFILRPDLYLLEDSGDDLGTMKLCSESRVDRDPYFTYLAKMHPEIVASLTGSFSGLGSKMTKITNKYTTDSGYGNATGSDGTTLNGYTLPIHTFIPFLTSRVESLQLPDYKIKSDRIVQPYTKYSIPYTQSAIESTTGGDVTLTFREDKYYSIHKLFYAWVYYEDKVMRNEFQPKEKYLKYNSLDYATSIYDFLVDDTGENVLYWAKYTGCVPTEVPMGNFGFNKGGSGETKVSISFDYFYCEHMDLNILRDFQYNSLGYDYMATLKASNRQLRPCSLNDTEPIYNDADRLGPAFNGRPVIICMTDPLGQPVIKLRWLKDPLMTKT